MEKLPNLPVYRVKPKTGTGNVRTLNQDHLLPIGDRWRMYLSDERTDVLRPVITRARAIERTQRKQSAQDHCDSIDHSNSDDSNLSKYIPVPQGRPVRQMHTLTLNTEKIQIHKSHESVPNQLEVIGDLSECEAESIFLPTLARNEDLESEEGDRRFMNAPKEAETERVDLCPKREVKPGEKTEL